MIDVLATHLAVKYSTENTVDAVVTVLCGARCVLDSSRGSLYK